MAKFTSKLVTFYTCSKTCHKSHSTTEVSCPEGHIES